MLMRHFPGLALTPHDLIGATAVAGEFPTTSDWVCGWAINHWLTADQTRTQAGHRFITLTAWRSRSRWSM